jgi:hypothetical protein
VPFPTPLGPLITVSRPRSLEEGMGSTLFGAE